MMRLRDGVMVLAAGVVLVLTGGWFSAAGASSTRSIGQTGTTNRSAAMPRLRVVTYNIRSCEGLDGHFRCDRIADILRDTGADVIALEEVRAEQAAEIAQRLGYNVFFGHADAVHGYDFGNAILTRLAIRSTHLFPIGVSGRQQRACLRADISWPGAGEIVQVFAVHLGPSAA
jgi:endonuclease/exonuclease/phosphatase family metal-dependent hydrolase